MSWSLHIQRHWWPQSPWAAKAGSCAAPTASLHFSDKDLAFLIAKGVIVVPTTLHVGLGTFLPIHADHLDHHQMHYEWTEIPKETIEACKKRGKGRVWALGSTVVRSLESYVAGLLQEQEDGSFVGATNLFIRPGFRFKWVDIMMTNFHQPRSTLLSMLYAAHFVRTHTMKRGERMF